MTRDVIRCLRLAACLSLLAFAGCYAPLRSGGIPASTLPDYYRIPEKAFSQEVNFAALTSPAPDEHLLGRDDLLRVEISDLVPRVRRFPPVEGVAEPEANPYSHVLDARVDARGDVLLPLVGSVNVSGLTLSQARQRVADAYSAGFLDQPKVSVTLLQARTVRVMVLGHVAVPNVYELPIYENDVAHAITMAGGVIEELADEIQIHRKVRPPAGAAEEIPPPGQLAAPPAANGQVEIIRIPLRSCEPIAVAPQQAILQDGDAVVVRELPEEVFFVVGKLSPNSLTRFSLGTEDRDLGNGFILPRDRDIDVVTAVAMAGYIDPIDSPTTVTVHRTLPDGNPMLIHVDLIAARCDRNENIMVRAGDIIYLNPDGAWWFRRTLDRVIPSLMSSPYTEAMERWINPTSLN